MQLSCYIHRNPLRVGMVNRLIDYKWSSYPVYAYGKKCPDWLSTQTILSYFSGYNKQKKYREKIQRYAKEEKYFLENIQHGMIIGAKTFVNKIREQYLPGNPHKDLPQQRQLAKDINVADLLKKIVIFSDYILYYIPDPDKLEITNHKHQITNKHQIQTRPARPFANPTCILAGMGKRNSKRFVSVIEIWILEFIWDLSFARLNSKVGQVI